MTQGRRHRATRASGRGRLGVATTAAVSAAMLAVAIAFAWLRIELPSEPARISSDDWPWTAQGVEVIPIGDAGPFRDGDVVTAIAGRSVEAWLGGPSQPVAPGPLPESLSFDLLRQGQPTHLDVALAVEPVGGLLVSGLPLLGYTLVQALVAVLAWLRRPAEGWRQGFLIGSAANIASALIWELGLRGSDLVRPEPMLPLFLLSAPMHLVFWSSVVHVLVSWPRRWEAVAGRRWAIAALYAVPQAALLAGVAAAGAMLSTSLARVGSWDRVLAAVVAGLIVLVLAALGRAFLRTPARGDSWLRVVTAACLSGALAVGVLTVIPVLVTGRPLASRSAVAALGLPLAVVLVVGTLRSRLFEVDVLLASRRRLVVAREEERRRIRRDLHDGIGPMLAAMTLKVDLARDVLRSDPDAADRALDGLKRDTQTAVAEIRRLTRELRPPALDELGVVEAIRQRAAEFAGGVGTERVTIEVAQTGALPPLDAAVEAAAYRITVEALTNVARHAHARHCAVRVSGNGVLVVEVADDGVGFAAGRGAGVGMTSMRERCAELGGSLAVERTPDGWTVVRATLPAAS
jgi:signal transduction histidine kinase